MLGADYSINNQWFFNAEYCYKDRITDLLWGHNNGYASIAYSPNELMRFSVTGLFQFEERRTIGLLSWYYSLLQNADLTVYIRGYNNLQNIGAPDLQYSTRVEVKF